MALFWYFFDKNLQPKAVNEAFKIEALEQIHEFIIMGMQKAQEGIITGFEVAIQVFDGRIVLRIFGVKKSSQTQTFSNKASFLYPQGCILLKNAPELFIWDQQSPMRHSIWMAKSVLGYSGPEWLYLHGFSRPLKGPFLIKIYNQRYLTKAFKINALEQRHECIPMGM